MLSLRMLVTMPRRHSLGLVAGLAALALAACSGGADARGPNLLLVTIDSLRPDHLGCYGYARDTSPVIDRLAREGVRFAAAVSTTSWTLPAHAALFTGMYDSAHGLVDNGLSLADGHRTLAEELSAHGYETAGFFGGPYLHPTFGLAQGFDHYQSCMTAMADGASAEEVRAASRAPSGAAHDDVTGPRTVEEFGRWLGARESGRPFFAFVHLWDVHYDYIPPPEVAALFADPEYAGAIDGRGVAELVRRRPELAPADRGQLVALYDAEIRFTDGILGRLLELVSAAGAAEETAVVVTADHGEEFYEHQGFGHQSSLFDEQILVPLIVHWPEAFAPRVVEQQVRTIDLMPTLLALAGLRRQPALQGRSLAPLLVGAELGPAPALCELLVDRRALRALRAEDWKALESERPPLRGGLDLARDPRERRLVQEGARSAEELARLRAEVARAVEFGRREVGQGTRAIEIPAELERTLGELGYAE
jgi:arylsulfatase A-like enzyme